MARADESLSRKVEQELTCAVCHDLYSNPILLSCSHTYCKKCVEDLEKNNQEISGYVSRYGSRPSQFKCPICRTVVSLTSRNGIDGLPQNLALANLVSVIATGGTVASTKWKFQVPDLDHVECGKHPGSKVSIFCHDCHKSLCPSCAAGCHAHKMEALEKVWRIKWDNLKTLYDEAGNQMTAIDERQQLLDAQMKAFDDEEQISKDELKAEIEILKSVLSARLAQLNKQVHSEAKGVKYPLSHDQAKCRSVKSCLETSTGRVQALLRSDHDGGHSIQIVVELEKELKDLLHKRVPRLLEKTIPPVLMPTWQLLREKVELSIRTMAICCTGRYPAPDNNAQVFGARNSASAMGRRGTAMSGADENAGNRRTLRPVRSLKSSPEIRHEFDEFRTDMKDGFGKIVKTLQETIDSCTLDDSQRKVKSVRTTRSLESKFRGHDASMSDMSSSCFQVPTAFGASSSLAPSFFATSASINQFGSNTSSQNTTKPFQCTSKSNANTERTATQLSAQSGLRSAVGARTKAVTRAAASAKKDTSSVFGPPNNVLSGNFVWPARGSTQKTSTEQPFNFNWKANPQVPGATSPEKPSPGQSSEGFFASKSFGSALPLFVQPDATPVGFNFLGFAVPQPTVCQSPGFTAAPQPAVISSSTVAAPQPTVFQSQGSTAPQPAVCQSPGSAAPQSAAVSSSTFAAPQSAVCQSPGFAAPQPTVCQSQGFTAAPQPAAVSSSAFAAPPPAVAGKSDLASPLASSTVSLDTDGTANGRGGDVDTHAGIQNSSRTSTPCQDDPSDHSRNCVQVSEVADANMSAVSHASTGTVESGSLRSSANGVPTFSFQTDSSPIDFGDGSSAKGDPKTAAPVNNQTTRPQSGGFDFARHGDVFSSQPNAAINERGFNFSMASSQAAAPGDSAASTVAEPVFAFKSQSPSQTAPKGVSGVPVSGTPPAAPGEAAAAAAESRAASFRSANVSMQSNASTISGMATGSEHNTRLAEVAADVLRSTTPNDKKQDCVTSSLVFGFGGHV